MHTNIGFLFDLDGVLIDSERKYTEIWNGIDHVFPTGIENFATKIKGTTLENILSSYFPSSLIQDKVKKMLYEEENRMLYEYKEGAEELLKELKCMHIPAVLVTSSNGAKLSRLWMQLEDLEGYFQAIIDGDMVSRSKPDPQGYLLGAQAAGCVPEKCVVFEDSLQGVKAGNAAGAYVIGVAGTLPEEFD